MQQEISNRSQPKQQRPLHQWGAEVVATTVAVVVVQAVVEPLALASLCNLFVASL